MNSWRASRADWKASFRQTSSSLLSMASGLLHRAEQRVLVLPGVTGDLGHLGFRDLVRDHAAAALAAGVDLEHDAGGGGPVHPEYVLEHVHHERHRGVVVV